VMYSTPKVYVEAKKGYNQTWPVQLGDMFPYADCVQCYWTGAAPLSSASSCPCPDLCHDLPCTSFGGKIR